MTNEQKARDIATRYSAWAESATLEECINQSFEVSYNNLLKMAQWKDKQFAKEKQQLIEKACEWLKNNIDEYFTVSEGEFEEWFNEMFNDFKKAMEE